MKLKDNVAIVTGAGGGGIGRAIAHRLAAEGATVIVTDINADNAQAVADAINNTGGTALAIKADVTKSREVGDMVRATLDRFGRIDILVNNAGGSAGLLKKLSHFKDTTEDIWKWVLDLNLNGTLICIHSVITHMVERRRGKIINIASIAAEVGILNRVDYSAAKGAIISLTRALAMEVGPHNINVNCVSPGAIATRNSNLATGTWLGREGQPAEVASLVAFLASEEAAYITGQNHIIDGGRVLGPKAKSPTNHNVTNP
ncbi:SDR family oxidoreductase [Opitutaceae bacterium TAV4]|nr:SDR family oxidoreductase [Opitutaceae bacterium TAV4]